MVRLRWPVLLLIPLLAISAFLIIISLSYLQEQSPSHLSRLRQDVPTEMSAETTHHRATPIVESTTGLIPQSDSAGSASGQIPSQWDGARVWVAAKSRIDSQFSELTAGNLFKEIKKLNEAEATTPEARVMRAYSLGYLAWIISLQPERKNEALQILVRALQDNSDEFYQGYAMFALYGLRDEKIDLQIEGPHYGSLTALEPSGPTRVAGTNVFDMPFPAVDPAGQASSTLTRDFLLEFIVSKDVAPTTRLLSLEALAIFDREGYARSLQEIDMAQWTTLVDILGFLARERSVESIQALKRFEGTELSEGRGLPDSSSALILLGEYAPEVGQRALTIAQDPTSNDGEAAGAYLGAALRTSSAREAADLVERGLRGQLTAGALEGLCRSIHENKSPLLQGALRELYTRLPEGFRREAVGYGLEGTDPGWRGPTSLFRQIDELQQQINFLQADPTKAEVGQLISSLADERERLMQRLDFMRRADEP